MTSPCCPRWPLSWGVRKAALSHALPRPAHQLWLPSWLTTQLKASNVGCTQRAATRRCTVHSQSTLQQYAAAIAPPGDSAAAPACCQSHPSAMLLCHKLLRNGTRAASTRAHMQANLPARKRLPRARNARPRTTINPASTVSPSQPRATTEHLQCTQRKHILANTIPQSTVPIQPISRSFSKLPLLLPPPTQPRSCVVCYLYCSTCRHSLHVPYLVLLYGYSTVQYGIENSTLCETATRCQGGGTGRDDPTINSQSFSHQPHHTCAMRWPSSSRRRAQMSRSGIEPTR